MKHLDVQACHEGLGRSHLHGNGAAQSVQRHCALRGPPQVETLRHSNRNYMRC